MPRHALIPCLRYKDAPAAIEFLCDAFGFQRHAVYTDESDPQIVVHAQLLLDGNMIMLGSERPGVVKDAYNWKTPKEAGCITQCICAVIDDPDKHAARARAAGATIIRAPYDNEGYPGRAYDVADCEGHIWNFGSYDPFAE
ncbi:glyoxalase [Afipia sp. P52-10]|uniref:VOC family protein n=1 Tax=Afipia sp. P52-10 TaxID=1429916 RepID=UPI0003DF371D|nr:VOC family protein [Afipia sp. P52-10]ETR75436.1 glyoxalase [Afipia sp. P52-10]